MAIIRRGIMDEHIEYYTDLIAHLNEQINQENIKLFDYESMLLKEQQKLSEYSFFKRLFSNNKKFIFQLEKLAYKSTQNVEIYRKKIEDNKEKFVTFGTQKMIEESEELSNIEKTIENLVSVSDNIAHMLGLMKQSKNDTKNGMSYFFRGRSETYKSDKSPCMERAFNSFMSALNRVNDMKRYMSLDGFANVGDINKSFNKNTLEIMNDILIYDTMFNNVIIEKMRASTKHPHLDLLDSKIDVMERIDRNFDLLIISFTREHEKIQSDYSDMVIKKSEIENNYRLLFLNKIKKSSSLVIF
jgi:hypothetical protein